MFSIIHKLTVNISLNLTQEISFLSIHITGKCKYAICTFISSVFPLFPKPQPAGTQLYKKNGGITLVHLFVQETNTRYIYGRSQNTHAHQTRQQQTNR